MGRFDLKINGENPLIVRRATLEDRDKIFDFIKTAYTNWKRRIPDRWYWQFVNNPYVNKKELPIWIATDIEGKVIGQICELIEPIKINNTLYKVGWGIDFYVLSDYRGLGIGTKLLKVKDDDCIISFSLGMTSVARRIRRSLGVIYPSTLNSYAPQFSPESFLNLILKKKKFIFLLSFIKITGLYKVMTFLLNQWINIKRKSKRIYHGRINYVAINHFGKEVDDLWRKVSSEFDCAIARDSTYLNWKYMESPNEKYHMYLSEINEEIIGYIILRNKRIKLSKKKQYRGIIVDILFSTINKDHVTHGINFAIDYFMKQGIYDIRIATSVGNYAECIKRIGYPKPIASKKVRSKSALFIDKKEIINDKWLLSYGDSNQQQFI